MKDTAKYFVKFLIFFVLAAGLFLLFRFSDLAKLETEGPANILSGLEEQATTTQSQQNINGLKIETIKQGQGVQTKNGDLVSVHYTGVLTNGTKFDSSVDRGEPFNFTLGAGQVIKGWDLGVLGMKVGEKRKLTIQPEMGYGSVATGPIPANSILIFDVELLKIN